MTTIEDMTDSVYQLRATLFERQQKRRRQMRPLAQSGMTDTAALGVTSSWVRHPDEAVSDGAVSSGRQLGEEGRVSPTAGRAEGPMTAAPWPDATWQRARAMAEIRSRGQGPT